jgi:hypothetical protein
MKSIQQLIYKHFKNDKDINIIYFKTGSDYEKALLELPYNFLEIPKNPINSYTSINFDLVISQNQQQLQELIQVSHMLHVPVLHIEPEYFSGKPGMFAHEYIFPWNTQAHSWNKSLHIPQPVTVKPNTNIRELNCIYLDVDEQTQQIAQILAQKYPVKQIMGDSNDFSQCGILVNLVPSPVTQSRLLTAFSHGTVIVTWNTPFFQEIILDKQTGFLCQNPEDLLNTVDSLMKNLSKVDAAHKLIINLAESKFSKKIFRERWKQVITKWSDKIYKGVQT